MAKGNEKAFVELFYAYHNRLGEYVLMLTASEEVAQEIVQDIFVKIWMDRHNLAALGNFSSWLFILTRNYTLNYIRKESSELRKKRAFELYAIASGDGEDGPQIPCGYEKVIVWQPGKRTSP